MTNRLKELALIGSMPKELRTEVHNTVQEAVIKNTPPPNKKFKVQMAV